MGRIAGVAATQTRERLLQAAAEVFAERGYDGTRVADIATAAGVSNGALYAHFASKAELLVAALHTHGRRLLSQMLAADPDRPVTDVLLHIGQGLLEPRDTSGFLIIEALVAARRDQDVASPMRDYIGERADWLTGLIELAQSAGELDPVLSPKALAHFCLLLSMGSGLITPDLHEVDETGWSALLTRVIAGLGPAASQADAASSQADATASQAAAAANKTQTGTAMRLQIDTERCQGHGRCYDLVPSLFGDDDEGYGQVLGDGAVSAENERDARLAVANCPERAIELAATPEEN
jgi:AcrR family transcriptional regulator/ferredoxin